MLPTFFLMLLVCSPDFQCKAVPVFEPFVTVEACQKRAMEMTDADPDVKGYRCTHNASAAG